jgi:hypothetical protein
MAARRKTTSKAKVAKTTRLQRVEGQEQAITDDVNKTSFLNRFKNRKFLIPLFLILTGGIIFYFKGLFVVALVNGQPITRLSIIQELEKRGGKQMLSSVITQALILQEAEKQNVTVAQKEIEEEIKKVEDNLKKQGQSLDQALTFQGLTREDFVTQIRLQKLVEKMLAKDMKVTDREIDDYIEKNENSIPKDMKPQEVTASARQQLQQQKLSSKAPAWIKDLQEKAKIIYFVNF